MTVVFGLVAAVILVGLAFFALSKGTSRRDRPGPHNNWSVNKSTIKESSWNESEKGFNGNGGGASSGGSD